MKSAKTKPTTFLLPLCLGLICLILALVAPERTVAADQFKTPHVTLQLLSEFESIDPASSFWVALKFDIIPNWHIYWRNPGDSGMAPQVAWKLPQGFLASQIFWPPPKQIPLMHLANFGYKGEVLLLSQITAPPSLPPDIDIEIIADLAWVVCKEDCIPEEGQLTLNLRTAPNTTPSIWKAKIDRVVDTLAESRPALKASAREEGPKALKVVIERPLEDIVAATAFLFPYDMRLIKPAARQNVVLQDNKLLLQVERASDFTSLPDSFLAVLVVKERLTGQTLQYLVDLKSVPAIAATASALSENQRLPLYTAFFFAIIGGVLLNLMPCVFPVLSIKILAFVRNAADDPKVAIRHGYAFAAGIVVSMLALALVFIGLRAAGAQLGWGFQLQSPIFVAIMAALFFFLGLYFMGLIEFGGSLVNAAGKIKLSKGYLGSFASGLLATLVATPCTAPFMGSAIGASLLTGTAGALLIFLGLGIGMASPYLLLTHFPFFTRALPKPGMWMEVLKQGLAFPMFATTIWLLWVLGLQAGLLALIKLLFILLSLSFGAWCYIRGKRASRLWQIFSVLSCFFSLAVALWLLITIAPASIGSASKDNEVEQTQRLWQQFSPELLAQLKQEGRPIFIDFTAAWCLTCQLNKQTTLSSPAVIARFRQHQFALIRGDWTNRDPQITAVLEEFGRAGVPLNLIYGPSPEQSPVVLPTLLSPQIVIETVETVMATENGTKK